MKDLTYCLALIFVLGLVLLAIGRPFSQMCEGFQAEPLRCDVNTPCSGHLKCINGFCAKTEPIGVVERDEVPLLPPGSPAPYF
jgi:hypothetical protein